MVSSDQAAIDKAVSATLAADQPVIAVPTATADVDISKRDLFNLTQMHHAAQNNSLDISTLLIDRGADIEAKNRGGFTPLHNVAVNNAVEVANLLIDRGANTDGIDLTWMN
jgi:ankyrin repeat protein